MKAIYLLLLPLVLIGCTTTHDLGNGRVAKTQVSEERSAFGTNMGFAKLEDCLATQSKQTTMMEYSDCHTIKEWELTSSQGVGGQIVGGALTGLGFGLGSAFSGSTNSASAVSNASSTAARGGHR